MTLNDLVSKALRDLGYSGSLPGMLYDFFRSNGAYNEWMWLREKVGATGSLNDLKYRYLKSLGYSGSLNDMWRQALLDGAYYTTPTGVWILATGLWNDSGTWMDSSNWID